VTTRFIQNGTAFVPPLPGPAPPPARQRQVVALRLVLDLDTGRTAEVLGVAPGTVQAHLGRAMAALRADLMPEPQQENR
jgi:DNA-directed RNA polymerase specialized sigma24 family protein